MADIAQLGFSVDSKGLADAKVALNALPPAAAKAEKSAADLAGGFDKVSVAAGKATDASGKYSSTIAALAEGTGKQSANVNALAKAYDDSSRVIKSHTGAVSLNRMQMLELGHVVTALTDSLMAGQNPARALSMQIGRIGQIASQSQGGVKGLLAALVSMIGLTKKSADATAVANAASAASARDSIAMVVAQADAAIMAADTEVALAVAAGEAATTADAAAAAAGRLAAANEAVAAAAGEAMIAERALATANGAVAETAAAAAASETTAFTPVAAALAGILAVLAIVGAAFGLAARKISNDVGDVTKSMSLTTNQADKLKDHLDRLKDNKIDVTVTGMDSFKAFFQTIAEGIDTKPITTAWNSALDSMTAYGIAFLKGFYGTFQGASDAITATWQDLPSAFADVFIQMTNGAIDILNSFLSWLSGIPTAIIGFFSGIPAFFDKVWSTAVNLAGDALTWLGNRVSDGIDWIEKNWQNIPGIIAKAFYDGANKAVDAINWLVNKTTDALNSLGGAFKKTDLGHVANPFAGSAAKATAEGSKAFVSGYNNAGKALDDFGAKWEANAKKIAQNNVLKAVGAPGKEKKAPKGPKTDAEKFSDIVNGAQNDIATETARGQATTMSALAAATLAEKTKLLNEANTKGIALTDAMRGKIDELAAAYGNAKVAADNAIALKDTMKVSDADLASLQSQADLIGKYGRNLAFATEQAKLLAEMKAKGATPEAIAAAKPQIDAAASKYADQSAKNANDQFMEDFRKQSAERMTTLQEEASYIGMTADQAARAKAENDALAQARQKNIDLTPAEIIAIKGTADAQANLAISIAKVKDALDFVKSATQGFVSDFRSALEQGKSIWAAFGEAVNNVLNKILDRLLDKAISNAIDALFTKAQGGGGGILGTIFSSVIGAVTHSGGAGDTNFHPNALGGVYGPGGRITAYASGGVVNGATMFNSASGLGVMGEAGPEAIMPLHRGMDGSLGVKAHGTGTNGPVAVNINVTAEEGAMFVPRVEAIAEDKAVKVTTAGISQYDEAMPGRVQQIAGDERVR